MAHWSGIGIPKTNAIALEVSYTHMMMAMMMMMTSLTKQNIPQLDEQLAAVAIVSLPRERFESRMYRSFEENQDFESTATYLA